MSHSEAAAMGLTPMQVACMQVLQELMDKTGICPSYQQLAQELEIAGKSGVHRLVVGLEARGYLGRAPGFNRSLRILRRVPMPDFTTPQFVMSADLAERAGQ